MNKKHNTIFKTMILLASGVFLFTGCNGLSPSPQRTLFGKGHHGVVKSVDVDVNLRKDLRKYLSTGLEKGLNNVSKGNPTYSVKSSVSNKSGLDPRAIKVSFSNQHKQEVMKMGMEVDANSVDNRRFKATLNIVIGEIIKNVKKFNDDKDDCLCQASHGVGSEQVHSSGDTSSTLRGLEPIPLPKI